jgi:hypothetical protein
MEMLPLDFRNRFASLRALYGELSNDIHSAKGDPSLFERARITIVDHFEARRLFKLEDVSPMGNNPSQTVAIE